MSPTKKDVRVRFRNSNAMIRAYYFMCRLANDAGKKVPSCHMEEGYWGESIRLYYHHANNDNASIDRDTILIAWKKRGYRMKIEECCSSS